MSTTLDYLMTLSPEQMKEAVLSLPKEEQTKLAFAICGRVNDITKHIVTHADEIWETKKIPNAEEICDHEPGKFMHQALAKNSDVYECAKCGTPFTKKFYV